MLTKIKARIKSSKLLYQENFDQKSEKRPFETHFMHVFLAIIFLVLCALPPLALNFPAYWTARSLLDHGISTGGVVEKIDVEKRFGRGEKYITTVDYYFRASDGKVYRGTSTRRSGRPEPIAVGDGIEIMHDPSRPSVSGWRSALHGEVAGVFGVVFASALVLPYCAISLYRYARWIRRRRYSRRVAVAHAGEAVRSGR